MLNSLTILSAFAAAATIANAHIAFWDPSMWGYNVSAQTYPYDNRPMVPLMDQTFEEWWFHGHLDHPPHQGDFFELPAGGTAVSQLACNKGATKWWAASEGTTDIRQGDYPCPNSPLSAFHTTGEDDLKGCALAITYKSDVNSVQPEDFAVFSVNHKCVWNVNTAFPVPAAMPACPEEGCICAWFWIHSVDSGSEQNYMNGFRCKVTGSSSATPIAKAQLPRRCGAEPDINKKAAPGNCTVGPKQPFYWYQKERNNMLEGQYSPPYYNELYNFLDGAQNDIFEKRDGSAGPSSSSVPPAPSSSAVSSSAIPPVPSSTPVSVPVSSAAPPPASSPAPSSAPAPGTPLSPNAQPSPATLHLLNPSFISSSTESAHYGAPSPSGKSHPRSSADRKRQEAVARHFKRRLNDHHH